MSTSASSEKTTSPLPLLVRVKKELPDIEIKDYAESAMKEVLGWYGYERGGHSSGSESGSDSDLPRTPTRLKNGGDDCLCCAWCQKVGSSREFSLKTPSGNKVFCSEQCFTQCRRASFKRNKTCDWCRHVRHTVNYVDFQDGDHQLQFCSDKCLNQYKMNIFCKETEAQLEAHPHLRESNAPEQGLITPDLWLRDCRSPGGQSEHSPSPQPPLARSDTKKEKEPKKRSRRPRGLGPHPRLQLPPFQPPPPPPPWRRKPDVPPLLPLPIPRPLPLLLPPPTTLVPYPIFIPIPVPIPIPLPLPGLKLSDLQPRPAAAAPTPTPAPSPPQPAIPLQPPRKRKRLSEISPPQETDTLRKPKSVHA